MRRPLDESIRLPLLTDAGRRLLRQLHEHPAAPRFNFACGDQLDGPARERVRAWERREIPPDWPPGKPVRYTSASSGAANL